MAIIDLYKQQGDYFLKIQHLNNAKNKTGGALKEWESFVANTLEDKGIRLEEISRNNLEDFILKIIPVKINLNDIKIQNNLLISLLKDLDGTPLKFHTQESYLDNMLVRYTNVFGPEEPYKYKNLHFWNGSEPILHGQHKGLDKLYNLSRDFCERRIKGKKYPDKKYPGNTVTLGEDYSRVFFTKDGRDADTSVGATMYHKLQGIGDSAKRALDPIWDEAQRFIKNLSFLRTDLIDIRVDIDVKSEDIYFSLSCDPKEFITPDFNSHI